MGESCSESLDSASSTHTHTSHSLYLSHQCTLLRNSCKHQGGRSWRLTEKEELCIRQGRWCPRRSSFIYFLKQAICLPQLLQLLPQLGCPIWRNERIPLQPPSAAPPTSAPRGDMGDKNAGKEKLPRACEWMNLWARVLNFVLWCFYRYHYYWTQRCLFVWMSLRTDGTETMNFVMLLHAAPHAVKQGCISGSWGWGCGWCCGHGPAAHAPVLQRDAAALSRLRPLPPPPHPPP